MAVTGYHAVKATVDKAIQYIIAPGKTNAQFLVTSNMCSADEHAAEEFAGIRKHGSQNGTVLAHHLIQSFAPGETTPEQAHQIGILLAERFLKGQYQYILATHVDRQHIHNHIIFNNTSFADYHTFNRNENRGKRAWKTLQIISDQICEEFGLSVITTPEQKKGKCWFEWQRDRQGRSWKKRLKAAIDDAIMASGSLDDFFAECKKRGIAFQYRPDRKISLKFRLADDGQQRWTRARTLGWYYEPEQIKKRITNYTAFVRGEVTFEPHTRIIETDQSTPGLAHWAMLRNMQEASRMINFLTAHGLTSPQELDDRAVHEFDRRMQLVAELNALQRKIDGIADDISLIRNYRRLRPVYEGSFTAVLRKKYASEHADELQEYALVESQMQARFPDHSVPKTEQLEAERKQLIMHRKEMNDAYKTCKKELAELEKARATIAAYLQQAAHDRSKNEALE